MYKVILIIVSVFLLSCNLSKSNNSLDEYTEVISNELKSIYADSFDLSVKSKNDTLFIEVSDLPDYRTGKDYNILLSKYLINCFYEQSKKLNYSKLFIKTSHSYNDLRYSIVVDQLGIEAVAFEYSDVKGYKSFVKELLIQLTDKEAADVSFVFDALDDVYPNLSYNEGVFTLLIKNYLIKTGYNHGLSESEVIKQEFALMLLCHVADFPIGDLTISSQFLDDLLKPFFPSWRSNYSRDEIELFYKENF